MTAEYNLPDGFDLDDDFTTGQGEHGSLADLAANQEWDSWADIVAQNAALDDPNSELRPGSYAFPEDAIWDAYDVGILDFVELWWDGEYWHLLVTYDD